MPAHWDMPLRFVRGGPVLVEQDTPAEVANCVEVAARTRLGTRVEAPEFGIPSYLMQAGEIDLDGLRAALVRSEPRAAVIAHRITDPTQLRAKHVRLLLETEET